MRRNLWALSGALAMWATAAAAGEVFVGAYDHDVHVVALSGFEKGAEISAGYRSAPMQSWRVVGGPSAYGFGAVNTAGGVDYAAAGLSWRLGDRVFLRPGIGIAVHNGEVHKFQQGQTLNLGSRVLAELELGLGWQITPRASLEASLVHLSHGQLAGGQNPGLDDLGVRLSWTF